MSALQSLVASTATLHTLNLCMAGVELRVVTNDADVFAALGLYYAPYVRADDVDAGAAVVRLIHGEPPHDRDFRDVPREGGRPVKEAVREADGDRFILKRETGVVMGLRRGEAFAIGDLRANLNQAVNLVNACYAKAMLARGHVLLHAAGVSRNGRTAVLSGVPGAGKSTAALHLVEAGFRFLSNDRVLARPVGDRVEVLGYPKQPRVNPGTLLHHPRLVALLEPEERETLEAMPREALWALERKRDVDLDLIYGAGTVDLRGTMAVLVLLRWRLDGEAFAAREIGSGPALEHAPIFAKHLGVFDLDRALEAPPSAEERARYAPVLQRTRIVEVTGRPNFPALVALVRDLLGR